MEEKISRKIDRIVAKQRAHTIAIVLLCAAGMLMFVELMGM